MGSGSVSAYGELEKGFRDDLTLEDAKQLAIRAIKAGILYDLGSGSNVDFVILKKGKTDHFRNYEIVGKKQMQKATPYSFERNNISYLTSCASRDDSQIRQVECRSRYPKRNGYRKRLIILYLLITL